LVSNSEFNRKGPLARGALSCFQTSVELLGVNHSACTIINQVAFE